MSDDAGHADATPGWRSDPTGRHRQRYWDGGAWTAFVAGDAGGAAGQDPLRPEDRLAPPTAGTPEIRWAAAAPPPPPPGAAAAVVPSDRRRTRRRVVGLAVVLVALAGAGVAVAATGVLSPRGARPAPTAASPGGAPAGGPTTAPVVGGPCPFLGTRATLPWSGPGPAAFVVVQRGGGRVECAATVQGTGYRLLVAEPTNARVRAGMARAFAGLRRGHAVVGPGAPPPTITLLTVGVDPAVAQTSVTPGVSPSWRVQVEVHHADEYVTAAVTGQPPAPVPPASELVSVTGALVAPHGAR